MADIYLYFNPEVVPSEAVRDFRDALRFGVAENLTSQDSGGQLTPDGISLHAQAFGPLDLPVKDVEVTIIVNDLPGRRANLDERRHVIAMYVKSWLPLGATADILVSLQSGSYEEIQGAGRMRH